MNRKRIWTLTLAFLLVALLTACGNRAMTQVEGENAENETVAQQDTDKDGVKDAAGEQKNTPEQSTPTGDTEQKENTTDPGEATGQKDNETGEGDSEPTGTEENGQEKNTGDSGANTTQPTTPSQPSQPVTPTQTSQPSHKHDWKPVYKTVHHDAEYKTVHHDAEYKTVHHDAEYKTVHHDAEYKTEKSLTGYNVEGYQVTFHYDGKTFRMEDYGWDNDSWKSAVNAYQVYLIGLDVEEGYYGSYYTTYVDKSQYSKVKNFIVEEVYETTQVLVKDAWDEQVLVKAAWDEKVQVKAAWDEKVQTKAAWDEQVLDHYECSCGEKKK